MNSDAWFTNFLKNHPGARWRQTGGPPFPSKAGKKAASSKRAAKRRTGRGQPDAGVTCIELILPLKTVSEANQRDAHWGARHRRNKAQQEEVKIEWLRLTRGVVIEPPCVVKLTRIGPKPLDDGDNLNGAFKHVRDAIAAILGVDDGSPLLRFEYAQVIEPRKRYAVKIEIRRIEQ